MLYQFILCSILFSFLYQLCHIDSLSFKYFKSRSRCDYCNKVLDFYCLIPIISYILLKGKSRCCKHRLSLTYIIGELLSLSPCILLTSSHLPITLTTYLLNFIFLLVLSICDYDNYAIPLHVVVIYIICAIFLCEGHFINFLIISTILHCLFFIFKQAIGYGDILIFSLLSFILPFQVFFLTLQLTFIIAGMLTLILMMLQRRKINKVPLIPYILLGFITANLVPSFFKISSIF
ncbi:prepilin peptidase [Staphylococcus gallinarum]|uniref:prepilin peptidase n=1 Tax=Staphylococcus gallinarum TaxID=1293 RepID=UPI0039EF916C|nr:prepilin peptidase [Staphylococcus gallinarum]